MGRPAGTIKVGKLTALQVVQAKEPGLYGDGGGLWLRVQKQGAKTWVFRFKLQTAREMGLGPLHTYSLLEARELAKKARQLVHQGKDPIQVRDEAKEAEKLLHANAETFKKCAQRYIEGHKESWKNAKHRWQWSNTLERFVYPVVGELAVGRVTTALVLKVIEPLWAVMPETAARVRGRIEKVLDWAQVRGYRSGENPARWRGHLENVLPKLSDVRKIEHHPALPYSAVGEFMVDLRKQEGIAAEALQFTILTAVRTNEAVGARWSEIDLDKALWVIPSERMKGRRSKAVEHRVPLSSQAVALLRRIASKSGTVGYVFPGTKEGKSLSNMAMLQLLGRMGRDTISVHGFRSSFSDWARETTAFPRDVVEMALAHAIKDKTEAAYFRADLLAKRAALMQTWADYCDRILVADGSNVVQMSLALA